MPTDRIRQAARLGVENPFSLAESRTPWPANAALLEGLCLDALVSSLLNEERALEAERLVLAAGHVQAASTHDASEVLSERTLGKAVMRRLPRPRSDYLRVAMAAGRCYRALTKLHGDSAGMRRVRHETWTACFGGTLLHTLKRERVIADHDVLILGETGTGKESVAHAVQEATLGNPTGQPAPRAAVNAAAIPATLIESELFGHVKGAFTGAAEHRQGKIRSADGGCFFLDEVGDLDPTTQVKLLRVMETDEVVPVGADTSHRVAVRYVAATHVDLPRLVEQGLFRADLFHRLAGSIISVPPLRERLEDVPRIGMAFVRRHLDEDDLTREGPKIEKWLRSSAVRNHTFPGNVRELQNALRDLMLGLSPQLTGTSTSAPAAAMPASIAQRTATLREVEDWYLRSVLEETGTNYTEAARRLGLDRATARRRARRLGL